MTSLQYVPAPGGSVAAGKRIRIDSRRRWIPDLREFFASTQLLLLLCRRDVTVLYRQTILGAIWVVLAPLTTAGLFTFVFGSVAKLSSGGIPYFAFSYAGLLAWNLISTTLTQASQSMVTNQPLFTRIYFSRMILPVSQLAPGLINLAISLVVMLVMLFAYQIGLSLRLLTLPLWLGLAAVLSIGVSLILAAVAVLYRDVRYVTQALVPLLMFLTPVAYSTSAVPASIRTLYLINPCATIVDGCRWSLLGHTTLSPWAVVYTTLASFAFLLVGLIVFARLERKFADVV